MRMPILTPAICDAHREISQRFLAWQTTPKDNVLRRAATKVLLTESRRQFGERCRADCSAYQRAVDRLLGDVAALVDAPAVARVCLDERKSKRYERYKTEWAANPTLTPYQVAFGRKTTTSDISPVFWLFMASRVPDEWFLVHARIDDEPREWPRPWHREPMTHSGVAEGFMHHRSFRIVIPHTLDFLEDLPRTTHPGPLL